MFGEYSGEKGGGLELLKARLGVGVEVTPLGDHGLGKIVEKRVGRSEGIRHRYPIRPVM